MQTEHAKRCSDDVAVVAEVLWVAVGKLLAFSGPAAVSECFFGYKTKVPEDYCPYFKHSGVTAVIRLNRPVRVLPSSTKLSGRPTIWLTPIDIFDKLCAMQIRATASLLSLKTQSNICLDDVIHQRLPSTLLAFPCSGLLYLGI